MAAQTIKAQVEELVGSTSIASLDDWAGDAINKLLRLLPYKVLAAWSTIETETFDGTGITAKNKRIFEVFRKPTSGSALNRRCEWIDPQESLGELADSDSLYLPTSYDPKWTIYTDEVVVLPSLAGMVITVRKIALISPATFDTTGTAISSLPEEAEYLVVLDLAHRVATNKGQAISLAALTVSATPPTAPTLTSVSFTDATSSTVSATSVGALPSVPTYTDATLNSLFGTASTAFDTAMTSEDIELAQTQLGKMSQYIADYSKKIEEGLGEFQVTVTDHQLECQRLFNQAQITLQEALQNAKQSTEISEQAAVKDMEAIIANNQGALQKYQGQVAQYQQEVADQVSEYQSNIQRNKLEFERFLGLAATMKAEYLQQLFERFQVELRPKPPRQQAQ